MVRPIPLDVQITDQYSGGFSLRGFSKNEKPIKRKALKLQLWTFVLLGFSFVEKTRNERPPQYWSVIFKRLYVKAKWYQKVIGSPKGCPKDTWGPKWRLRQNGTQRIGLGGDQPMVTKRTGFWEVP